MMSSCVVIGDFNNSMTNVDSISFNHLPVVVTRREPFKEEISKERRGKWLANWIMNLILMLQVTCIIRHAFVTAAPVRKTG